MSSSPVPLKVALLGWHHPHASLLLRTLQNLREVSGIFIWAEQAPVPDPTALRCREKVELITRDLSSLLARNDIGFAIVCVRTDLAASVSTQVILAGKPLLLEKPGGLDSTQILGLHRLARRHAVPASILYGQRAHPAVQAARRLVAAGTFGRLLSVEARMITTQVRLREPRSWLFQRAVAGGGILTWLGCHYLVLRDHSIGDPILSVSARLGTLSGERIDVEDVAMLTLGFGSGAVGTFHAGYLLGQRGSGYCNPGGFDNYLACSGQDGRFVWRGVTSRSLEIEMPPEAPGQPARRRLSYRLRKTDSYGGAVGEAFVRRFIAAVRTGGELPTTLADALRTARIVEAAHRSAATQRTQRVKTD